MSEDQELQDSLVAGLALVKKLKGKVKKEKAMENVRNLLKENNLPVVKLTQSERLDLADRLFDLPSPRQQKFVVNVLGGMKLEEAVADSYPDTREDRRSTKAVALLRHPKIKEIVDVIRKEIIPRRLGLSSLAIAIPALEKVAKEGTSEKAKVQAATKILEFGVGTPPKQIRIEAVNWHGSLGKSFLRDRMKNNINKNLEKRGEGEIIDVASETVERDSE